MLVEMYHSKSRQVAYRASTPLRCSVCGGKILQGQRYTRHQAPDPKRRDPYTGRYAMIPYIACGHCAPYKALETQTGELDMRSASMEETQLLVSVPPQWNARRESLVSPVRTNTNRLPSPNTTANTPFKRPEPTALERLASIIRGRVWVTPKEADAWLR